MKVSDLKYLYFKSVDGDKEDDDDDRFYIALFSTLEQTHCARMWLYMRE